MDMRVGDRTAYTFKLVPCSVRTGNMPYHLLLQNSGLVCFPCLNKCSRQNCTPMCNPTNAADMHMGMTWANFQYTRNLVAEVEWAGWCARAARTGATLGELVGLEI